MNTTIETNLIKIFEYLTALKNLTAPVASDLRAEREFCWWQADLPEGCGCLWNGADANRGAWLEIRRQIIPPPPAPPEPLRAWLIDAGLDPKQPPTRRETIVETTRAQTSDSGVFFTWIEGLQKPASFNETMPEAKQLTFTLAEEEDAEELAATRSDNGLVEITFESDPERVALWQQWREREWQAWADAALAQQRTNRLYEECFALYQRLQRESDQIELLLGDGLLAWQTPERTFFRPLFVQAAELLFDAESNSFAVVPTEGSAALELEVLSGVPLAHAKLLSEVEAHVRERGIDLRAPAGLVVHLQKLAFALDENAERYSEIASPNSPLEGGQGGVMWPQEEEKIGSHDDELKNIDVRENTPLALLKGGIVGPQIFQTRFERISGARVIPQSRPQLFHAPLLFVRRKAGRHWQDDFKKIIAAIRNDHPIAPSLTALVNAEPFALAEDAQQKWQALAEQIHFPLPANEEQREIARRLAQHCGVAVQGPPGTGKSHTIVNLIAHLLAHGKRVLITSQTSRALRVLGEMIKQRLPEIAPLCVAVLESETHGRAELERSLAGIYEKLAAFDFTAAERALQEAESELAACREEIAHWHNELLAAAEEESASLVIHDRELKTAQAGLWLEEHRAEHGWLPDEIPAACEPVLSENEMLRLHELLGKFAPHALDVLAQALPPLERLPTAAQIAQAFERIVAFEAGAARRETLLRGWTLPESAPEDLERNIALAEKALRKLESFSAGWLRSVLQDVAYGGQREEHWQNFARECRVQLRSIRAAEKALAHFSVALPAACDMKEARANMNLLYEELSKNHGVSLRFRYGSGKTALRVFEECRLNGNAPRTAEDVLVLLRYLDVEESKRKFWSLWANAMREVGGPAPEAEDEQLLKIIEDHLRTLEPVLGWNNTYLRALAAAIDQIKPYGPPAWQETEWLKHYRDGLLAFAEIAASAPLHDFFAHWSSYLREGLAQENAHALWARLLEALEGREASAWEEALQELQRLNELLPQLRELQELRERLRAVAPRWLMAIEEQRNDAPPVQWQAAWEWQRIHAWHKQRGARTTTDDAQDRLRSARTREARLLETHVARGTWLQQARHTATEQLPALYAWLKIAQKLGANEKGELDQQYREEAAQLLRKCRSLIPVWIMPLERVIETFAPTEEKFDVIIVDESSQCPLFALSALFRGERAVIIGDHKQVSPEAEAIEHGRVRELIARHLADLPNQSTAMWDLEASLFDHAQAAFSPAHQSLSLREHFRCAPEIIRFSNEQFYDEKIEPLRLPLPHERLEPAIIAEYAPEGRWNGDPATAINQREAEALVAKIAELCNDERYAQRTMGVISLQGMAQAELIASLLRERLGGEELLRRRLLCGEAKHFQGDERDVMFLAMVVSASPQPEAFARKADEQRFNVAASRARDQLWLFHSLALEDLSPRCIRHRLLKHCLAPASAAQTQRAAHETFEYYGTPALVREVYERLQAQGYRVIPEMKIGSHPMRLDLAVEGRRARVGIICEGKAWRGREHWEEEFARQSVLERAGWQLARVYGSVYYHNPEKALASLQKKLEEMGIKPALLPKELEKIFSD
jgi:hypothetical protein